MVVATDFDKGIVWINWIGTHLGRSTDPAEKPRREQDLIHHDLPCAEQRRRTMLCIAGERCTRPGREPPSPLHIKLLAQVVADLHDQRDAFGIAGFGLVAWSASVRNSQESSLRRTSILIPSGQSAWA